MPTVANDFRLSSDISARAWLANQKKVLAQNNLPSEKATLITALLGKSEDKPDSWDYKYNEIKAYVDKNGELPVGVNAIILSSGTNSDTWIRNQRQNLSNGIMLERKSMLNAIGITASAKRVFAKDVWQPNYNEVLAFYKENGKLPGHKIDFKLSSGSLGSSWVKNEQQAIKNNERNSDQLKLLSKIGITNRPRRTSYAYWLINYNAAKQHYVNGGNHLDPHDSFALPTGTKLSSWIEYMHVCLRKGRLSDEQVELLKQIGITQ